MAQETATEALSFWENDEFSKDIQDKGEYVSDKLADLIVKYPELKEELRGRGLMKGSAWGYDQAAGEICKVAFERGIIMESSGPSGEVMKLLLTVIIDKEGLKKGFEIIDESIQHVLNNKQF